MGLFGSTNTLEIILKARDEATKPLENFKRTVLETTNTIRGQTQVQQQQIWNGKEWLTTQEKTIKGMTRFRMELLSVMFFGMAMQRLFMGMLQPAMEVAGIFDIISIILEVLFLPIVLALLPFLLEIMNWFLNLPEGAKMFIGILVLVGAIIGTLLMVFGQLGLGLMGVAMAFGGVSVGGTAVSMSLGAMLAPLGALIVPILAIIAIVALLWLAWETNFGNCRQYFQEIWDGIKNILQGVADFFGGIFDIIVGIVTMDTEKIGEGIRKMWSGIQSVFKDGIWKILVAFGNWINDMLWAVIDWGIKWVGWVNKIVWQVMQQIFNFKSEFWQAAKDAAIGFINWFVDGLKSIGSKIADTLWSIIPEPFKSALRFGKDIVMTFVEAVSGTKAKTKSVTDAIITPYGDIIHTAPSDWLVATKTPPGGGTVINISPTINMTNEIRENVDVDYLKKQISEEIVREVAAGLRR